MYSTIRRYTGNPGLADKLAARRKDIENIIKTAPGFVSYYLLKTADGAISVTVCEDKMGAEKSNQIAADWLKANMAGVVKQAPEIYAGDVVITTSAQGIHTRM